MFTFFYRKAPMRNDRSLDNSFIFFLAGLREDNPENDLRVPPERSVEETHSVGNAETSVLQKSQRQALPRADAAIVCPDHRASRTKTET